MGCCQSQHNIKKPKNTQQPIQNEKTLNQSSKENTLRSAPRPLEQNIIQEKQRIDTPMITEDNQQNQFQISRDASQTNVKAINGGGAKKSYQYFDISPKVVKKNKIYKITNKIPPNSVYSNPSDWQKIFKNFQQLSEDEQIKKILSIRARNWIKEQIKHQIEISDQNAGSLESLVTSRRFLQMREHFNWLVWAVGQYFFQQKQDPICDLPKFNSRQWTDGFEYKGVYFKVLPYEEAYHVHNEMKALKYVQTELLELQAISPQIQQTYQEIKSNFAQDVILPLIQGISCGGFYLYGSPVIQTEELDQPKDFHKDAINNSKSGKGSKIHNNNSIQQMQAMADKSNMSYSYLHNNINPDFIQDSIFKFMPILKNIQTTNMIPIIDFEEYHEKQNEDQIELKYILVNLFEILPRLSESNAATILMRFPCHINEEITFHPFPKTNYMEQRELTKMLSQDFSKDIKIDHEEENTQDLFYKKFFTKHGWDFILLQKQGSSIPNKKATNFYNQREIQIHNNNSQKQEMHTTSKNMLFIDDFQANEEIKEQNRYISPQKQTILKRTDSNSEEKIQGNCILAGYNSKNDFKVQYSMCNHTYSSNIETLFSASVEQVAKIIEQSDNIYNIQSLKELLHRKGLNIRFEWVVLTKIRINLFREIVMIDILLRTMRKIINEEIKIKSKVQHNHVTEGGATLFEEFYVGNQIDQYKDVLTFYMNAILKRKFTKHKQVFDETLLGLFLSRNQIIPIAFQLNLRKEEYIYLESKDILEDIIESPSKNPVLFINGVQTYFNIEFKPEFLRICRQDKYLFLSKSQPVTVDDIKQVQVKPVQYFTIREQAYFMLAKQITHHSKRHQPKMIGRVKTKSEKDRIKQSFQKPRGNGHESVNQSQQSIRENGIGPSGLNNETSTYDQNDSKTVRNWENNHNYNQSINTIRQYRNIDNNIEPSSPPMQESKTSKAGSSISTAKKFEVIDLSKLTKKSNFKPTSVQEIIMPSVLYKLKTFLQKNAMYCFDQSSKTYIGETLTVFNSYYEMPNIDIVNEWVICMESLLKDVYSCTGSEQVLLEAFVFQAILIYFFENDSDSLFKVLTKIRDTLYLCYKCAPETIMMIQIITGMFFEEQKEQHPLEAEKNYLTSLICQLQLYGDPRGRGNIGIPYSLFISWKLSLLSLSEDKKVQDSEFTEELFDATLKSLFNHNKLYKEQQLLQVQKDQRSQNKDESQKKSILTPFEQEIEKQEFYRQIFDIKKYNIRSKNLTVASGRRNLRKGSHMEASQVYVSHNPNFQQQMNKSQLHQPKQNLEISSKSYVVVNNNKKRQQDQSQDFEVNVSDVDLEVQDENKHFFIEENFKNNEQYIGTCPFQHWSLYRQQIAQILQAHNNILVKNNSAAVQYQKQIYKEMLQKGLPKDQFYQWMIKFNPILHQSGMQWSNQMIMDVVFSQNQQMVSSSGSSVAVSNQRLSQKSLSSIPNSAKERKHIHLGSYSQILGKEVGGISKQDMKGVIFDWGTDASGQLGQDILTPSQAQLTANLKVLFPRMVVSLKDEIIKEICCGHSHTLVINIHGQVFSWGLNESGQLGLGPNAPPSIKKPILNPYLHNIVKLSAGNEHSLALTKIGDLYSWGGGGLTGTGELQNKPVPAIVDFFSKTKIQIAVCGGLHTIAVTKEGETYSWGSTEGGQLGLSAEVIQQQCPNKEQPILKPQKIPKLEGQYVVQVSCGEAHTIVLTKENQLFGWGMSNYGQLGLGFSSDSFEPGIGMEKSKVYEPEEITALKDERIQKVYCGATFSLFQTEKGDLYGCGMNDLGQLGLDTFMEEMQIATLQKAKKGMHQQSSDVTVPAKVICFQGIPLSNIACGENHALAVSGDEKNMLWSWGMYKNGQLGLGEINMKMNPRPVQTLCSSLIQKIACGSLHSLALIGDTQQITTLSDQYYVSNDVLANYWTCDIRGLCVKENYDEEDYIEEDIPDDKEGQVKNPK